MAQIDNRILEALCKLSSVVRLTCPPGRTDSSYRNLTENNLKTLEEQLGQYIDPVNEQKNSVKTELSLHIVSGLQSMIMQVLQITLKEVIQEAEDCQKKYIIPKSIKKKYFAELSELNSSLKALTTSDTKAHIDQVGLKISHAFEQSYVIKSSKNFFRRKSFLTCCFALASLLFYYTYSLISENILGFAAFSAVILCILLIPFVYSKDVTVNSVLKYVLIPFIISVAAGMAGIWAAGILKILAN